MGRFVKNVKMHTGSYAISLPGGTHDVIPQYPEVGQIRYNQDLNKLEVYYGGNWNEISSSLRGRVHIVKDTFVGNGTTKTFAMAASYNPGDEAMMLVFVGNLYQNPGEVYTVSGSNITFTDEAPANGVKVLILHNFNSTHAAE
jgi:hypothetical protein